MAPRSTYGYKPRRIGRLLLRRRIREIATMRVRYGYRRIHGVLRLEGWPIHHKRVHRLYREEGLQMRLKLPQQRVNANLKKDRCPATEPNPCWGTHFITGFHEADPPDFTMLTPIGRRNAGSDGYSRKLDDTQWQCEEGLGRSTRS